MINQGYMFGGATDLQYLECIGALQHLVPDMWWLQHTVSRVHQERGSLGLHRQREPNPYSNRLTEKECDGGARNQETGPPSGIRICDAM